MATKGTISIGEGLPVNHPLELRDGFISQPPVDRRLPPVTAGWLRSMHMNIHARMTANRRLHAQPTGRI